MFFCNNCKDNQDVQCSECANSIRYSVTEKANELVGNIQQGNYTHDAIRNLLAHNLLTSDHTKVNSEGLLRNENSDDNSYDNSYYKNGGSKSSRIVA